MTPELPTPLAEKLATTNGTSVILYGAEWCPMSRDVRALIDSVDMPAGVECVYVDVDLDTAAPAWAGLRCVPTVKVYRGSEEAGTAEFAIAGDELAEWVAGQVA